jgi:hypothetical protein
MYELIFRKAAADGPVRPRHARPAERTQSIVLASTLAAPEFQRGTLKDFRFLPMKIGFRHIGMEMVPSLTSVP